MYVEFATCDRHQALKWLQQIYPSCSVTDTADSAGPLLDLVQRDVLRIRDPNMYGYAVAAVGGKNAEQVPVEECGAVVREFHNRAMATKTA